MRVQLVLLCCVLAVVAARNMNAKANQKIQNHLKAKAQQDNEWTRFKTKYGKVYSESEEPTRRQNFFDMKKKIEAQNVKYVNKESTFFAAVNAFTDMTHEEFVKERLMKPLDLSKVPAAPKTHVKSSVAILPNTVDWRTSNYVTGVKDQGQCGSCWSFSTTGALEGQHAKATGDLISLSEQNLVDCTLSYGNMACDGGWPYEAMLYIRDNKGIDTEASYPYEARLGTCRYNKLNNAATDTGYVSVAAKDESALQDAVATVGPISVLIDASHESFQIYGGGVYYELLCNPDNLDHAVLAVGYGTDSGSEYWLVKNSWGVSWGINGYIEMSRNRNNNCGIASQPTYPTV